MADSQDPKQTDLVTLTIDGRSVQVKKGTNLIEAAKVAGVEVPHYCYHPHLSVAGNCRMCQVSVKGQPKLTIACNTNVAEGMEVQTHLSSKDVADAQAATLEFILINHPLDCTVCDQAGHCKLQDYHYQYNARSSRFLEEKVHKPKAIPLGPTVMLDGERCIMCTRCIRFCDEVTQTSELGMLNRGDQSVIAVSPGKELDNPLSGTVVDLCPVGALTHREWRFNTRIWFTKQTDAICPGCSTGCNVKVAERDGEIVHVKARRNDAVNKEWLCDEGRYGFGRFLPQERIKVVQRRNAAHAFVPADLKEVTSAIKSALKILTILVSPDLLLEEYILLKQLLVRTGGAVRVVMGYRERELNDVQRILMSPDYAANMRGAQFAGLVGEDIEGEYVEVLGKIRRKELENIIVLGDRAVDSRDVDSEFLEGLMWARTSVGVLSDANSPLAAALKFLVPGRSILEKSGMLLNRRDRLQYSQQVVSFPPETLPVWRFLGLVGEAAGCKLLPENVLTMSDRDVTRWILGTEPSLASLGLSIAKLKEGGFQLEKGSKEASLAGGDIHSGAQSA
jgi:NADH-quinone oxidoreductase subunit G